MSGEYAVTSPTSQDKDEGIKWLWKADEETELFQYANDLGTRIGMAVVTLNTARPLDFRNFKEAFRIAQRKCQNLRMALRQRGEDLWFTELLHPDMDIKMLDGQEDIYEVIERITKQKYNSVNQPDWRVRLIPRGPNSSCALEHLKKEYPHQYDFIFQTNHILFDGMNIALIVNMIHKILDRIIVGDSAFDDVPEHDYSQNTGLEEVENTIKMKLQDSSDLSALLAKDMPPVDRHPLILRMYPKPELTISSTKHITRLIGQDLLKNLRSKSTEMGVTFNSTLVAIVNCSLVNWAKKVGVNEDFYDVYSYQLVNLRRYLDNQDSIATGAYQFPMSYYSQVQNTVKDNFWEYAKQCHQDLQSRLKSGRPLEQKVFKGMRKSTLSPSEFFKSPPPVLHDSSITNVGDLTRIIPGEGQHVQVTHLMPFNIIHDFTHMNIHQIVTFRGQSHYTFSYDTSYLTQETAKEFVNEVFFFMTKVGSGIS